MDKSMPLWLALAISGAPSEVAAAAYLKDPFSVKAVPDTTRYQEPKR
jgi:hypothetical protein